MMPRPQLHSSQSKARDGQRKVSPPGPTYMSSDQFATYLKDLRTNRPSRPGGSRPLPSPGINSGSNLRDNLPPRASSSMSMYGQSNMQPQSPEKDRPRASSSLSNHRPFDPRISLGSSAGRPLVQEPRTVPIRKTVSPAQVFTRPSPPSPNATYRESGQRRIEKEEARSLRDALQGVDLNDEVRLHQAAQDEATELVWMHQNPGIPFKNPYAPYHNPDLDRLSQSPKNAGLSPTHAERSGGPRNGHRLASESSPESHFADTRGPGAGLIHDKQRQSIIDDTNNSPTKSAFSRRGLKVGFALPVEESPPKSELNDNRFSKGIFRNPRDSIYEEPKDPHKGDDGRPAFSRSESSALKSKPRNALPRGSRPLPGRLSSLPFVDKLSRFELHKRPPTQSTNPEYRTNESLEQAASSAGAREEPGNPTKNGVEVRSDDIRAATSKKLKDRSTRLPMPTAVSDRVGRPIVSFDPTWKPTEVQSTSKRDSLKQESTSPTPPPQPTTPTIEVSEAATIPVINLPDDKEPTISEMTGSSRSGKDNTRPLPNPTSARNHSHHSPKKPAPSQQKRWLSTYTRSGVPTAKCESCSLPIAGKIVTAGGARFHPECFVCHHCQTPLECVAFYQEPDAKRTERLAEASRHDEEARVLRFYCHLDFHELFSPRCKSCKTPIEGEIVVACGAEWHVGHFFCAECGDPFNSQTPFVEKDGFAWCLQCHSRRTAPRCLGCKQPVLDDVVISAVGGQWHDQCFVCHECGDGFGGDGRYFVREGEPKRTSKGRIIGGPVQLAVCERCESIRLKASPK
ncbi:LIM domain protein [Aspergillus clavatus NRRL 1]|uniref:LIM domain protein n=1 Tax=Aspergillus clavatus (strain ATCC 1007 / CBS 513.65 / DSM 816 / NCTC 3887 / NRRL 1 / QM 1276 / 107) TaxID=344612 RepID=A1CIF0_ASPCL|nr:LIM domain protein [Aspergillus clavatus NRRL 1]EAW10655.1 LIM domain protein [Aspergillus clavatus NRRL 1]